MATPRATQTPCPQAGLPPVSSHSQRWLVRILRLSAQTKLCVRRAMDLSHGQTHRRAQYRTTSTSRAYILRLRRESTLGWPFGYVYHLARVIIRLEDQLFPLEHRTSLPSFSSHCPAMPASFSHHLVLPGCDCNILICFAVTQYLDIEDTGDNGTAVPAERPSWKIAETTF